MRVTKFTGLSLAFVAAAVAIAALGAGMFRQEKSDAKPYSHPYSVNTIASARMEPKMPFFVVDVDCDGNDDLFVNESNRLLWYRLGSSGMVFKGESPYERPASTRMVADIDGDGYPEFFVLMNTPDGVMIDCYKWFSRDASPTPNYRIDSDYKRMWERPWSRVLFLGNSPPTKDAPPIIFIGINTLRQDDEPRRLLACDGATGRRLWSLELAPYINNLVCGDFGESGARVLFSTVAVGNGLKCNDTTDSLSYVFCLDPRDGRLFWRKKMGGVGSRTYVDIADMDGDGRNEVVIARSIPKLSSGSAEYSAPWGLGIFSVQGELLSSTPLPFRLSQMRAQNLDKDPHSEIVVSEPFGRAVILNHDLSIRYDMGPIPVGAYANGDFSGIWDLRNRGTSDFIFRADSILVVRNQKRKVVAKHILKPLFRVQPARFDGMNGIVIASQDSIHLMALRRVAIGDRLRAHSRLLTIGAAAAMLLAGWTVSFAGRSIRQRRGKRIDSYEAQNELLTAMSAFGHGGSSLKVLDRLRLHLKNWERIRSDGVTKEELFARLRETYRGTIVPELEHLVMLARRARVPDGFWYALLARAEAANGEMEAILSSGPEETARRDEHIAKALDALDDVDMSIAGIRAHLRSVFRAAVAEELERMVERFRMDRGAERIVFALAVDSSVDGAVFISPVSFSKVFEAIISNAVRASDGKAGAEISIAARWEGDYCRIDIRDNGCGIANEDWERIFERHYTTKDVGGFGLYYAREELARFGGKIYVFESAAGAGTTMRVVLRKSEKAGPS